VRYDVGTPPTDVDPFDPVSLMQFLMVWMPVLLERPDGSRYGLHVHLTDLHGFGHEARTVTGGIEHPDGTVEPIAAVEPHLRFDPANRRLLGGRLELTMADGTHRPIEIEVPTATGFHLGTGLYFGWQGHHHGEWRGELHVEGERIADCSDPAMARELHQIRDTFVVVHDPVGGGRGIGNCQPVAAGGHPELGLDEATSFW
jgi:hypothetical protein